MKRETLVDFFDDRIRLASDFLTYEDRFRTYTYSYDDVRKAAQAFARRLASLEFSPGDKVVVWSENRPEWVIALWGCLLSRAVLVPVDYRASSDLLSRVVDIVDARILLLGEDVPQPDLSERNRLRILALNELGTTVVPQPSSVETPELTVDFGSATSQELAEIIFTSGATANPKGVQLTHRNILANIVPVEREIIKYRKYAKPFQPLRFLNLLPLSHMFGQAMATFIPPMLNGVTVFMRGYNPADIVRQIHDRRISVLVCVPKMLEILREHVVRVMPDVVDLPTRTEHVARRWWRYRRVHRLFGFKFWAFVVGAAPLDSELETFWSRLGFLVIQGYGLTETAPIVTLNHPFRARRGTVGTPIGGVEIKVAPDGEILVRGDNVTSGYYNAPTDTAAAFSDGWFRTGDIGSIDEAGRLSVRGRKKEIIVTPEGLNVFPDDVERVLRDMSGVRDAAIVGAIIDGKEQVHAVLVLNQEANPEKFIRIANERLEDHQMIQSFGVWPDSELPRTEGTRKLKRREIRRWVMAGAHSDTGKPKSIERSVMSVVQRFAVGRSVTPETTLNELGLSSITRIELMMALEQTYERSLNELAFAKASTIADLQTLMEADGVTTPGTIPTTPSEDAFEFPTWNRTPPAAIIRRAGLTVFLLPLTRMFAWITLDGLDRLSDSQDPVVYAANHQSHMDVPVILAALPPSRRNRVTTAAAKEFFAAHFHPTSHPWRSRLTNSLNYYLATLMFNMFPLPQREAGARATIRYIGELLSEGSSVLIFPEGRRTDTGNIAPFQPGIGMIASKLRVPVVPIRIDGIDKILHQSWRMARPGKARVSFGTPLHLDGSNYDLHAKQVEDAVRAL